MKYIKLFEEFEESDDRLKVKNIEIGDYLLINITGSTHFGDVVKNFINNNIGQLISTHNSNIKIGYDNVPKSIDHWFYFDTNYNKFIMTHFTNDEIMAFSKTKNQLEKILIVKKFNI